MSRRIPEIASFSLSEPHSGHDFYVTRADAIESTDCRRACNKRSVNVGRDQGSERKSGWWFVDGVLVHSCTSIFIALLFFAGGETILYVVGALFLLEGVIVFICGRISAKRSRKRE